MPENEVQEVMDITLEKTIETRLVQSNLTEQVLVALKSKYGGLKLKALDDKESYLELKAAAKECAKVRTLAVGVCKKGREEAVRTQKAWVAKEKEVVGRVAEVEDPLDAEIAKFNAEVDRLEQEELKRKEDAYISKQAALTKMGATYAQGHFVLGETSFSSESIKESDDEVWNDVILPKYKAEFEIIEAVKIAEQKKRDEEQAEFKRQQDILQKQQEELRKQQEELDRQKQEAENKAKQEQDLLIKSRCNQLASLGMKFDFGANAYVFEDVNVTETEIRILNTDDWGKLIDRITPVIQDKKKASEELAEQKRLADIESAKQQAIEKEKQRLADEARIAEEKRIAELEAANDRTKWEEFIKQVNLVETFEMRSGQYRKKMQMAKEKLEEIKNL